MSIRFHTFAPGEILPRHLILPVQTHSANIVEARAGMEPPRDCDGLFSSNPELCLGVKTADCAPVVFIGRSKFGVVHAGWRGLTDSILENMLEHFASESPTVWIGPLLPEFEIQKDFCYDRLVQKFGDRYFDYSDQKIVFRFLDAILSVLPSADYCNRSTLDEPQLASWRRDKNTLRGQNVTVVGKF